MKSQNCFSSFSAGNGILLKSLRDILSQILCLMPEAMAIHSFHVKLLGRFTYCIKDMYCFFKYQDMKIQCSKFSWSFTPFLIKCKTFFIMAFTVLKEGHIISQRKLDQLLQKAMEHIFFRPRQNVILYSISSFIKCFLKHGNRTPDLANSAFAIITFIAVKLISFSSMQILKDSKYISMKLGWILTGKNEILACFFQINTCDFFSLNILCW